MVTEKKGKKSQIIQIQRKGRAMDFETSRFFFIPWKIPENLLSDNGRQISKGKQKHPCLYYWEMKLIPYSSQIFTLKSRHPTPMQKVPFFHMQSSQPKQNFRLFVHLTSQFNKILIQQFSAFESVKNIRLIRE